MEFRKLPKASLHVKVPREIVVLVKTKAIEAGKSDNVLMTEMICREYGIDPARFGLEAEPEPALAG